MSDSGVIMERNYHPRENWIKERKESLLASPDHGCQVELYSNLTIDPRYKNSLIKVDELTLQNQSGVYSILNSMDTYDLFYYSKTVPKNLYQYNLFTRESFYFNRQCEIYGNFTRQDVFEKL
jgi:hypothetical protein